MLKETCPVAWRNPNSRRKAFPVPCRDFSSTDTQQQHSSTGGSLAELNELTLWFPGLRAAPQSGAVLRPFSWQCRAHLPRLAGSGQAVGHGL